MLSVYYSYRFDSKVSHEKTLGFAHYSYGFAKDSFCKLFDLMNIKSQELIYPQIYNNTLSKSYLQFKNEDCIHISFKGFEWIRPLDGYYNICLIAWEFESISKGNANHGSILDNQMFFVDLMDEIWVGCNFTQKVLLENNIKSYVVPHPINTNELFSYALPKYKRVEWLKNISVYSCCISRKQNLFKHLLIKNKLNHFTSLLEKNQIGKIFTSVLNPFDLRKNLINMIQGFNIYSECNPNDILIIKLSVDMKVFPSEILFNKIAELYNFTGIVKSDNIFFVTDYLNRKDYIEFLSISDFYLCTSNAEGQNVPLQEAMALGVVPISTCNTAMLDFINSDNAILINSNKEMAPNSASAYPNMNLFWHVAYSNDISEALNSASKITKSDYLKKSKISKEIIFKKYSFETVSKLISDRFIKIGQVIEC